MKRKSKHCMERKRDVQEIILIHSNVSNGMILIHSNHERSKEKEKQIWKTAVFRQLVFSTRES